MTEGCETVFVDKEKVEKIKSKMKSPGLLEDLANFYKVFGDQTRVRILHVLSLEEICVCDIAALLDMSQSAISHQLRLLKKNRLVKSRREGKMVYYSLDDEHIEEILAMGVEHLSHD